MGGTHILGGSIECYCNATLLSGSYNKKKITTWNEERGLFIACLVVYAMCCVGCRVTRHNTSV